MANSKPEVSLQIEVIRSKDVPNHLAMRKGRFAETFQGLLEKMEMLRKDKALLIDAKNMNEREMLAMRTAWDNFASRRELPWGMRVNARDHKLILAWKGERNGASSK